MLSLSSINHILKTLVSECGSVYTLQKLTIYTNVFDMNAVEIC